MFSIDGSFTASMSVTGRDPRVRAGAVDVVRCDTCEIGLQDYTYFELKLNYFLAHLDTGKSLDISLYTLLVVLICNSIK